MTNGIKETKPVGWVMPLDAINKFTDFCDQTGARYSDAAAAAIT